jgi:P27 family predicted phage terminase small subunit
MSDAADAGKSTDIVEPHWPSLLSDRKERAVAKAHWARLTGEMRASETLSATNGHALQRLVIAYIVYDRCSLLVAKTGVVNEPAADNPKAIARISAYFKAQSDAEKTAERLEAQLGLSPGRRGKVGKVSRKRERSAGADAFLGPRG